MAIEQFDVVIVGAGPAGITCALELSRLGVGRIAILEGGRPISRRHCPVDYGRRCGGCAGTCNVIKGFGGSIHYGDGVKLSKFPSGRRLAEVLGREIAAEAMTDALAVLFRDNKPTFSTAARAFRDLELKSYDVAELSGGDVSQMLESLLERIASDDRIQLSFRSVVSSISRVQDSFAIRVADSANGTERDLAAAKVLVAVGRGGENWWRAQSSQLGVKSSNGIASVGLRFECPRGMLRAAGSAHPDFKLSAYSDIVKVKTFCFCAGVGGGRIKFTDYGTHTLLDGHTMTGEQVSSSDNFALLAQLRDEHGKPYGHDWIMNQLLPRYQALRPERPGKPVAQWYEDFCRGTLTCRTLEGLVVATGMDPSAVDYAIADISSILPRHIFTAFREVFEKLVERIVSTDRSVLKSFAVMGLELEGLWREAEVSRHMESSVPGLYIAGDCAGIAQGILQASVSGLVAARGIATIPS